MPKQIIMEKLFAKSLQKINNTSLSFTRSIVDEIYWDDKLIGIKGQRGVGKTTLLLQYLKRNFKQDRTNLYISLDDIYFSENKLTELVDSFVKTGGEILFIDEVHKYEGWSQEIKNFYDDYADLKIVFTGSSLLKILNARADLSRRAMVYDMQGLSFREFLNFSLKTEFSAYPLSEILDNHFEITVEINKKIKPLKYFSEYLKNGYFPFFKTYKQNYLKRTEEIINIVLEVELPSQRALNIGSVKKLKQLLYIISQSVPFKPNISKLSERIGISRNTLASYFKYLDDAKITRNLHSGNKGISDLQKPEKIYLENPSFVYALGEEHENVGNLRETFFINQISKKHNVVYTKTGDFYLDNKYTFEIGGKNKTSKQIAGIKDAFIVADEIEYGFNNKIPLWLFGFLY